MLQCMPNSDTRGFLLKDISPDGMTGYLAPKPSIHNTHQPIAVSQYDDGVLRIGTIQIDTKRIVYRVKSCAVTATAFNDGVVGVNIVLLSGYASASVYCEYAYDTQWQTPLYFVKEHGYTPCHKLKPFSRLSRWQKIAKVLSLGSAYPRATV